MSKSQIENEIEYVLSMALSKCGDSYTAEDLTQEVMMSALVYQKNGGIIEKPRAFLATLLNRKYNDMLRSKYRLPTVTIEEDFDLSDNTDFTLEMIRTEDGEDLRREVAYLAESYRSVIVKHYFQRKGVSEIAAELGLPVGTVKSRLSFGREQVKKGLVNMEKYQENSFIPQYLAVRNSGGLGINEEPMSLTENDILAQNLLILAYEKPLTVSELSKAIGVPAAYVEPVVNKLVDGELMKRMKTARVYTDFIIYHASDFVKYIHEEEEFVAKHIDAYTDALTAAINELKATSFYSRRLERFMMIQIAGAGLYQSMESSREHKQVFPVRPNGGSWIAFATIYPKNYMIPEDKRGKEEYCLSGMRCTMIDNYLGATDLKLYNYESSLGPAAKFDGYGFNLFQDIELNMLKFFYIIQKKIKPGEVDLDTRMIKAIPLLEERGFISMKDGAPELLIPVLTHQEEKQFFEICAGAQKQFGDSIKEHLALWCKTHMKEIPPHLTSVPDQKRTLPYEPSTMMFVYEAIRKGLHPRDLGYPCPETFAVFD